MYNLWSAWNNQERHKQLKLGEIWFMNMGAAKDIISIQMLEIRICWWGAME